MFWLHFFALLIGGVLAASGFIIAKKPEAKEYIDKVAPYQGAVGIFMLIAGVLSIKDGMLTGSFEIMKFALLFGLVALSWVVCELLLGFMLGFGLIAKWIPGEGAAEKKGVELQQKLMKIQAPLGIISIVTALLMLAYELKILSVM